MVALGWAFGEKHFVFREHGYIEMLLERLTTEDVVRAAGRCELLEEYPDRPEGFTKLLLGYVRPDRPIHLVVNVEAYERDWSEPLVVVTVYEPERPSWLDERTRARKTP